MSKCAFKSEKVTLQENSNLKENKSISLVNSCQRGPRVFTKNELTDFVICQAVGYLSKLSSSLTIFFSLRHFLGLFTDCIRCYYTICLLNHLLLCLADWCHEGRNLPPYYNPLRGVREGWVCQSLQNRIISSIWKRQVYDRVLFQTCTQLCYFSMGLLVSRENNW